MYRRKNRRGGSRGLLIIVVCGLLLGAAVYGCTQRGPGRPGPAHSYRLTAEDRASDLYLEIMAKSGDYGIKPQDARVDRVWKAIPGYNGLEVDADASYIAMRGRGQFEEKRLVFKETGPQIHLDDLGPEPIYRGNPAKPMAAFLINVAWGNEFIPPMLAILERQQVKATFFFDGSWVKKNPDLALLIYEKGHEVGNHAYSHPDLTQYSQDQTREEIEKTNNIIEETLGVRPLWFAPPSGSFNEVTVQTAASLGLKTILWTVDTVDWKEPSPAEMVERVLAKVENGAMILMHPTRAGSLGLEAMIEGIRAKGLRLGTVADLMDEGRVAPLPVPAP